MEIHTPPIKDKFKMSEVAQRNYRKKIEDYTGQKARVGAVKPSKNII